MHSRSVRSLAHGSWVLLSAVLFSQVVRAQVRIGDPESVYDESLYDARFPQMVEWAKAGVVGGIPRPDTILATLQPGGDIPGTLRALADELGDATTGPHGVVLLEPGEYEVDDVNIGERRGVVGTFAAVWLPPGIVLRGADRDTTVIRYRVTVDTDEDGLQKPTNARYAFGLRRWSAVENVTLINAVVEDRDPSTYLGKYDNFDIQGGKVGGVGAFGGSAADPTKPLNAWVQGCRIQMSGSKPVWIETSTNVTLRDNIIDMALNKGDGGNGYYFLLNAMYVLMHNETIANIRHVSLQNCRYCVVHGVYSKVDINWHSGDEMRNALLERSTIDLHPFHPWPAVEHYIDPVKEGNLIYKTLPDWSDGIWTLRQNYDEEPWIYEISEGVPPIGDTLYPVTGQRLQPPDCSADPERCNPDPVGSGGSSARPGNSSGGASVTGGASGVAAHGAGAHGGSPGSSPAGAGAAPSADAVGEARGDDSGCGCRTAPRENTPAAWALGAMFGWAALVARLGRRRAAKRRGS